MESLFKDVKGTEDSVSQAADEETPSVQTPKKKELFDWEKVNFGFLHSKIIKKMFGSLGEYYSIGKSGNDERFSSLSPSNLSRYLLLGLLHPLPDLSLF